MLQFLLTISDSSDHEKIKRIYDDYHLFMLKYATGKLKNIGRRNYVYEAEDVVQNSFMKITRYVKDVDFSLGEKCVKNYVFAILNNEICNFLNDNQELDGFDEDFYKEEQYDFIEEIDIKERYKEVIKAIENLDEKYSMTLFLFYCKEMSVDRISKLMGISAKTVYTRIARGKILLLNSMKGVKVNE